MGASTQEIGVDTGIGHAEPEPLREGWPDIAHPVEFIPEPGAFDLLAIGCGFKALAINGLEDRFCRQHTGFHGRMRTLDLGNIEKTGRASHQTSTGESQFRDRLEAAFVEGACTIGNPAASFKDFPHLWVRLETLEFLEWRKMRVLVIKPDDVADRNLIAVQMIEERSAIDIA